MVSGEIVVLMLYGLLLMFFVKLPIVFRLLRSMLPTPRSPPRLPGSDLSPPILRVA